VGFLWFAIPNILALLIFPILLRKVKNFYEESYTLPQIIKLKTGSNLILFLYVLAIFVVQIYAITINFLGSFLVIRYLTNLDIYTSAIIVFFTFTIIALYRGLKSSIFADIIKSIVIFVTLLLLIYTLFTFHLFSLIDIKGRTQKGTDFFDKDLALSFGIPTAISLLAAITIDQQQWQRGLSLKKKIPIFKTYALSAIIFCFILVLMSLLGFLGPNLFFNEKIETQLVSIYVLERYNKPIAIFLSLAILISLIAVGTAAVNAAASVGIVDLYPFVSKKEFKKGNIETLRIIMVILAIITLLIVIFPNLQIIYILMLVGSFRASLILPTWFIIFSKKIEKVFIQYLNFSIIAGMIIGPIIFIVGDVMGMSLLRGYASLIPIFCTLLCILSFEIKRRVFEK
jgi:Na+/proline symporter